MSDNDTTCPFHETNGAVSSSQLKRHALIWGAVISDSFHTLPKVLIQGKKSATNNALASQYATKTYYRSVSALNHTFCVQSFNSESGIQIVNKIPSSWKPSVLVISSIFTVGLFRFWKRTVPDQRRSCCSTSMCVCQYVMQILPTLDKTFQQIFSRPTILL